MDLINKFIFNCDKTQEFETLVNLRGGSGSGYIWQADLPNGIKLRIEERNHLKENTQIIENTSYSMGFGFCFSGSVESKLFEFNKGYEIKAGESSVFCLSNNDGEYTVKPLSPLKRFFIEIDPEKFLQTGAGSGFFPSELLQKLGSDKSVFFRSSTKISPKIDSIINEIFLCPYNGLAKVFFLEAKVFELIACRINEIEKADKKVKAFEPDKNDIERIMHAKKIFRKNLNNPPLISSLAKELGVSRTKFYNNFCFVCGKSPTEFIRNERMRKASTLLMDGQLNVSEVAWEIGYSNLGYFSKLFRQYYNSSPSEFKKKHQKEQHRLIGL